jgi:hypothetical protein
LPLPEALHTEGLLLGLIILVALLFIFLGPILFLKGHDHEYLEYSSCGCRKVVIKAVVSNSLLKALSCSSDCSDVILSGRKILENSQNLR